MRTTIVFPTTGRAERAATCLRQLRTTIGSDDEVVAVVDADLETMAAIHPDTGLTDVLLYSQELQGCSASWNLGLAAAKGNYIVIGADDLWFQEGWLEAALEAVSQFPGGIGMVGLNDGHGGPTTACTHWFAHRDFLSKYMGGVMAFECYKFCCNDSEAYHRAVRSGLYVWCEGARVRHDHPAHGSRPADDNDQRNGQWAQQDLDLFYVRQAAGFPDDFRRVLG